MIENLSYFFAFTFHFLSEPVVVIFLAAVFYCGRLFGGWTRGFNVWKYLILAYFGVLIFRPLEGLDLLIGTVFLLGAASMYLDLLRGIFSWSGGITDVLSALRFRSAYEDIRRLEREIEALKSQIGASQTGAAAPGGSAQQASWRAQAQARKAKSKPQASAQGTASSSGSSGGSQSRNSSTTGNGASARKPHSASSGQSHGKSSASQSQSSRRSRTATGGQAGSTGSRSGSQKQTSSQSQSKQQFTGNQRQGSSQSQSKPSGASTYTISQALRDKYLETLELTPGKNYTEAELKAAWRKMAFRTHPDKGGSAAALLAVREAYTALKS